MQKLNQRNPDYESVRRLLEAEILRMAETNRELKVSLTARARTTIDEHEGFAMRSQRRAFSSENLQPRF